MEDIENLRNKIIQGDSLQVLKTFPDNFVDTIITSPPYWGLRSYLSKENDLKEKEIGTEEHPQLYIDKIIKISCECMRVLKETGVFFLNVGDSNYTKSGSGLKGDRINKKRESDELYEHSHNVRGKYKTNWLQQKQKLLIPHRIAIALQEKGWIIRDDLVWCLEENEMLFIKINKEYRFLKIKDLFYLKEQEIFLPTINRKGEFLWINIKDIFYNGKQEIFEIKLTNGLKINVTEKHKFFVTSSGRRTSRENSKFWQPSIKSVKDIKLGEHLWIRTKFNLDIKKGNKKDYNDGFFLGFYVAEGNKIERSRVKKCRLYEILKIVYDNPNISYEEISIKLNLKREIVYDRINDYIRKDYIKKIKNMGKVKLLILDKGISIIKYKNTKSAHRILTCGLKDLTILRNFLKNKYIHKIYNPPNQKSILIARINKKDNFWDKIDFYLEGNHSYNKRLKDSFWNTSYNFINGFLEGFLEGDGHHDTKYDRWRVALTGKNLELPKQIMLICRILNLEYREENVEKIKLNNKEYSIKRFGIYSYNRKKTRGLRNIQKNTVIQKIKSIKLIGVKETYNLEVFPLYMGRKKGENDYLNYGIKKGNFFNRSCSVDSKKEKWNNLYCLGNGILTKNCKKITQYPARESIGSTMPFPVFDKFLPATEYIFQIVKSRKYYFDLSQIKNKIKEGTYKRIEYPLSAIYKNQIENNPYIKQKDGIDGYYKKLKKQSIPLGKYKKARENIPRGGAHIEYGGINTKEGKERYFKKLQDGKVVIGDNWNVELDNKILDANPTNAIMFKKENQHTTENSDHFARFPSSLPQMLILAGCPPKGIVMDPFMGSATTAIVAKKLGRDFVGIEINEKYIEMSMKQLAKIPPRLDKF